MPAGSRASARLSESVSCQIPISVQSAISTTVTTGKVGEWTLSLSGMTPRGA